MHHDIPSTNQRGYGRDMLTVQEETDERRTGPRGVDYRQHAPPTYPDLLLLLGRESLLTITGARNGERII